MSRAHCQAQGGRCVCVCADKRQRQLQGRLQRGSCKTLFFYANITRFNLTCTKSSKSRGNHNSSFVVEFIMGHKVHNTRGIQIMGGIIKMKYAVFPLIDEWLLRTFASRSTVLCGYLQSVLMFVLRLFNTRQPSPWRTGREHRTTSGEQYEQAHKALPLKESDNSKISAHVTGKQWEIFLYRVSTFHTGLVQSYHQWLGGGNVDWRGNTNCIPMTTTVSWKNLMKSSGQSYSHLFLSRSGTTCVPVSYQINCGAKKIAKIHFLFHGKENDTNGTKDEESRSLGLQPALILRSLLPP